MADKASASTPWWKSTWAIGTAVVVALGVVVYFERKKKKKNGGGGGGAQSKLPTNMSESEVLDTLKEIASTHAAGDAEGNELRKNLKRGLEAVGPGGLMEGPALIAPLFALGEHLFKERNETAMQNAFQLLDLAANLEQHHTPDEMECRFVLAPLLAELGHFEDGEAIAMSCLSHLLETQGPTSPMMYKALDVAGTTSMRRGPGEHMQMVVQMFTQSLKLKQAQFGPDSKEAAEGYANMAASLYIIGDVGQGLSFLEHSIAVMDELGDEVDQVKLRQYKETVAKTKEMMAAGQM